jgi:hypothetical protein
MREPSISSDTRRPNQAWGDDVFERYSYFDDGEGR